MKNAGVLAIQAQLKRQVTHWNLATRALEDFTWIAPASGWKALDMYLGTALESALREAVAALKQRSNALSQRLLSANTLPELEALRKELTKFREHYQATETMLDFYGDAIATRTNITLGAYLRACDKLAIMAMKRLVQPLGRKCPPVLTYVDKGVGASILKAGLTLWDARTQSPVAAIKVARHNLPRPTAIMHEIGHQAAHDLGWNDELAQVLRTGLGKRSRDLADLWSSWSSEIAGDAFAFCQVGFAAVTTLHDVLSGASAWVMRYVPGDPHPIGYVRVLLAVAMCKRFFGKGLWDDLGLAWEHLYPLDEEIDRATSDALKASKPMLGEIVDLVFGTPLRALGNKSLASVLDPSWVRPETLNELERTAGSALYTSDYWIGKESVRLLALAGLRIAESPERAREVLMQQEQWMLRLGEFSGSRRTGI